MVNPGATQSFRQQITGITEMLIQLDTVSRCHDVSDNGIIGDFVDLRNGDYIFL